MIILMVRMIILMGQDDGFPTPPNLTPPEMAFSEIYWAFPVTGRSHGLAAAAPGHGQVALGAKKKALGPALQVRVRPRSRSAPLSSSQAPLGHGLAPPPGHGNAQ